MNLHQPVTEHALSVGEFVRQDSHIATLVALDPLYDFSYSAARAATSF